MTSYAYRRRLSGRELLPVLAFGAGIGAAAAYVAQILVRRTPLDASASSASGGARSDVGRAAQDRHPADAAPSTGRPGR